MDPITETTASQPVPGVQNPAGSSSTASLADQDTFLKLLVAQLANQDPLNPAEGTEWISQLAEFSSLEQLTEIKDGIEALRIDALLNKQS